MITGFDKFHEAFSRHRESFILIGGTAVQMVLGQYDTPKGIANRARVTHDIDLLVITEKMTDEFKSAFRRFVKSGGYECYCAKERPHYYRFQNPKDIAFPAKIELLSHSLIDLPCIRYTPLALDRDESMSALVLDESLYLYALEHCELRHGFNCLKPESLIVFKAVAYLNLMEEYAQSGDARRRNDALKHRNDIFRILEHVSPAVRAELPESLAAFIHGFIARFSSGGANYLEWTSISQSIGASYLATDPAPLISVFNRLFSL